MKKLSTISLFIFGVVVISIMTAGLVFYQNKKDNKVASNGESGSKVVDTIKQLTSSGQKITLDMIEISKHNKQSDCWYLISGKVYNITSFFGSHPGGDKAMAPSCGKDATDAYMTKDPNATNSGGKSAHSSNATNMLDSYYIGDFNQTIGQQAVIKASNVVTPKSKGDDDEWDD